MKRIMCFVFFSCTLLLQSCFEIVEQLLVKNDGSGNFQILINMSKSRTKLNSIMKMKTVNGHKVPDKEAITQKVAEIERIIKKTTGISNVKTSLDFNNYIASLSCDFLTPENINTGIKHIAENKKVNKAIQQTYDYDPGGKTFIRVNNFLMKDEYQRMSNADKEIFATANYTSIFRFEADIAGAANKQSKISANKKAVMLKLSAQDILTGKRSIENKINLKQ